MLPTELQALIKWTAREPRPAVDAKVTNDIKRISSSRPLPPGSLWRRLNDFTIELVICIQPHLYVKSGSPMPEDPDLLTLGISAIGSPKGVDRHEMPIST